MDDITWITNRLPEGHGFTSGYVQQVLNDEAGADGVRELALADLLEELASQDRYNTVSIGGTSYSNPLLMERAKIWRSRAPLSEAEADNTPGSFQFVPIKGRTEVTYDEFGGCAEA